MRGKRRIFGLAALLLVLLAVPLVFGLGIVSLPKFSSEATSSTASVFVDPNKVIKDYLLDPGYQIGDTFAVHVNITGVTDLFTWQLNMSWDPSILNMSHIIAGEFLATADPEQTSSEVLGWVVNSTDNAIGYSASAETILGNVTGITGSGRLVSIEFLVVGYGCTDIDISISGTLPTTLLDSVGATITYDPTDGYFRNKLKGDTDANTVVDGADISVVIYHRDAGGPGGYERNVDIDDNTAIDGADISLVIANRGRHL